MPAIILLDPKARFASVPTGLKQEMIPQPTWRAVRELHDALGATRIATRLRIGRASVYRALAA